MVSMRLGAQYYAILKESHVSVVRRAKEEWGSL